jgi:hypothetical membrane protein
MASRKSRSSRAFRRLCLAGAAAAPVFSAAWLAAGLIRPDYDYDPRVDHISALSAVNAPQPWLMIAGFVLAGLLLIAFAVAMHRLTAAPGGLSLGATLVGLAGLALIVTGVIREDDPAETARGLPSTLGNQFHDNASVLLILALLLAPPAVAWGLRKSGVWPGLVASACLTSALTLALGLVFALDLVAWSGLTQRLLISAPLLWLMFLALGLYRRAGAGSGG